MTKLEMLYKKRSVIRAKRAAAEVGADRAYAKLHAIRTKQNEINLAIKKLEELK